MFVASLDLEWLSCFRVHTIDNEHDVVTILLKVVYGEMSRYIICRAVAFEGEEFPVHVGRFLVDLSWIVRSMCMIPGCLSCILLLLLYWHLLRLCPAIIHIWCNVHLAEEVHIFLAPESYCIVSTVDV